MTQDEIGDCIDIILDDLRSSAPGRMGTGSAQPDQVGAQAVDPGGKAALGDGLQRHIIQRDTGQALAGAQAAAA